MSHGQNSGSCGTDGGLASVLEDLSVSHQPNHRPRLLERPVNSILLHFEPIFKMLIYVIA